jgi:hypothetical protein
MESYPATILEFRDWFATEQACRDYIAGLRWPNGFVCPQCQTAKAWTMKRGLFWAKQLFFCKLIFHHIGMAG